MSNLPLEQLNVWGSNMASC